ncbi:MAG TPA: trehalose-phosphatase [Gammaproteobacteria bacterium]|nr:trehalose-phosphatase [Gammaproteobacteria bacterium]
MKPILDPLHLPVLRKFLQPDTLIAFDYDGTLAPIVGDPGCAEMRPRTRDLLRHVAMKYPTVVITGRKRLEALGFLGGIPLFEVIGNHGAENRGAVPRHIIRRVAEWRQELEKRLGAMEGVALEDKCYSLSVHYRRSGDGDAVSKIISEIENLEGARWIGGKSVVNIVPDEAPGKGEALLRLCKRLGSPRSIFVGDDDTDEDVFAMTGTSPVLGIRVGSTENTAADYYINDQTDIDPLLNTMMEPNL